MSKGSLGARVVELLFEGLVQSLAGIGGKRGGLGVAKDFDRFLARVDYHAAILALREVLRDLGTERRIDILVEVIRQFIDERFALHELASGRKYRFSF
jgi:hypothetical protein